MAATISQTIRDLIGDDVDATLIASFQDLIRDGFNFIADLIPADSELWHSENLELKLMTDSDHPLLKSDGTHRKVIKVTRTENGGIEREAKETFCKSSLR